MKCPFCDMEMETESVTVSGAFGEQASIHLIPPHCVSNKDGKTLPITCPMSGTSNIQTRDSEDDDGK